jgi:hypothetical protein
MKRRFLKQKIIPTCLITIFLIPMALFSQRSDASMMNYFRGLFVRKTQPSPAAKTYEQSSTAPARGLGELSPLGLTCQLKSDCGFGLICNTTTQKCDLPEHVWNNREDGFHCGENGMDDCPCGQECSRDDNDTCIQISPGGHCASRTDCAAGQICKKILPAPCIVTDPNCHPSPSDQSEICVDANTASCVSNDDCPCGQSCNSGQCVAIPDFVTAPQVTSVNAVHQGPTGPLYYDETIFIRFSQPMDFKKIERNSSIVVLNMSSIIPVPIPGILAPIDDPAHPTKITFTPKYSEFMKAVFFYNSDTPNVPYTLKIYGADNPPYAVENSHEVPLQNTYTQNFCCQMADCGPGAIPISCASSQPIGGPCTSGVDCRKGLVCYADGYCREPQR